MTIRSIDTYRRHDGLIQLSCRSCEGRIESHFDWSHFFKFAIAPLEHGGRYVLCKKCASGVIMKDQWVAVSREVSDVSGAGSARVIR
ncbi:hypothetical protein [Larsenimonas salina]|uniref:hypothetical protein n=1 Tax=Larsenimonas salina TaxID=1295565 RepID=UPI002073253E|nr:hypothetical protein [Larsenimonas salina]MCM5703297.1 hypothetical protein [Larsenimonas salina]